VLASACGFQHGTTGADAEQKRDADPIDGAAPDAPPGTAMLLHEITAYAPNSNAPLSAALPVTPAAGDVLVMVGAAEHGGLTSVTGGGVATWTRATRSVSNTNIEIWFGTTDGSSATVTIQFPPYSLPMWMAVSEWSGLATTGTLDAASSNAGSPSPAGPGTVATAHARDVLIFGVSDSEPNTFGVPAPGTWSAMTGVSSNVIDQAEWYQIVAVTGSYAPSVDESAHAWDGAIAALAIAP
jgi:hypothetical protein